MHYRLIDVPPEHVCHVKEQIEHWIEDAARTSAYFTADDVWRDIESGAAQLWLVWGETPAAVCVTRLEVTSKGKHCHIWIMVGAGMDTWAHLLTELETWAKREGCTFMRHEARPGWSKLLKSKGYHMPHVILEKEL